MNIKGILKDTMIITIITIVAGGLLGFAYAATKAPIAYQNELAKQNAFRQVFKEAKSFELTIDDSLPMSDEQLKEQEKYNKIISDAGYTSIVKAFGKAVDESGEPMGYVMNIMGNEGYGGEIVLTVGIDNEGKMNGYSVLSINETPGLGMKAKEEFFYSQFEDKKVDSFKYVKTKATSDNEIEAISGATITTNAVVNIVDSGLVLFQAIGGK